MFAEREISEKFIVSVKALLEAAELDMATTRPLVILVKRMTERINGSVFGMQRSPIDPDAIVLLRLLLEHGADPQALVVESSGEGQNAYDIINAELGWGLPPREQSARDLLVRTMQDGRAAYLKQQQLLEEQRPQVVEALPGLTGLSGGPAGVVASYLYKDAPKDAPDTDAKGSPSKKARKGS